MQPANRPHTALDALLDDAYITTGFDEHHIPTAAERIARDARRTGRHSQQERVRNEPPSAHEQLAQELNLTCTLILNAANAKTNLFRLDNDRRIEPEGALVFGCLLHLTGHAEGCRFWWQFAAGGGSHTAAYCLYLHHGRDTEFHEAHFWRQQADTLRAAGRQRVPPHTVALQASVLPQGVLSDILAQCHRGIRPHLPQSMETLINQLRVDCDDVDFGEIPQPSPLLASALAART